MPRQALSTLILAVLLVFSGPSTWAEDGTTAPVLRDLAGLEELKEAFNADKGVPRLVLLLSPT